MAALLASEGPFRDSLHRDLCHDGSNFGVLLETPLAVWRTAPQAFADERALAATAIDQAALAAYRVLVSGAGLPMHIAPI
jgi:hypothetical protein